MFLRTALSLTLLLCRTTSSESACTGSETNICLSVDLFAGETGYYNLDRGDFEATDGPSPTMTATIGQTLTFDQSDPSNWYHAIGFAYEPDGAHGSDWGGDELPEVEGAGELQYLIDGTIPTCDDAGDTGLDCYEPEFFYPRGDWMGKTYSAELTITPEVAAASHGGVIYYFCHIHSKMSGKIMIQNEDGTPYINDKDELDLYKTSTNDVFDTKCGTSRISEYADGANNECNISFFAGKKDTDFEKCLQAVDCQMHYEMYSETKADGSDKIATFMQQMIPHHANAVNMAKLLLKQSTQAELDAVDDLEDILNDIINTQNFQIHQFRNYLNPEGKLFHDSDVVPPSTLLVSDEDDDNSTTSPAAGFFVLMFSGVVALTMMM